MRYYKIKPATKAWKTEPNILSAEKRDWQAVWVAGVGYEAGRGGGVFSKQRWVFLCPGLDKIICGLSEQCIC